MIYLFFFFENLKKFFFFFLKFFFFFLLHEFSIFNYKFLGFYNFFFDFLKKVGNLNIFEPIN